MATELIFSIAALFLSSLSLLTTLLYRKEQSKSLNRMRVLQFASEQLGQDACKRARRFLQKNESSEEKRDIHEYIRSLDRIGNGLKYGTFETKFFFEIWRPSWVISQWYNLSYEIQEIEQKTNKEPYFEGFEWLTNKALELDDREYFIKKPLRDDNGHVITKKDYLNSIF